MRDALIGEYKNVSRSRFKLCPAILVDRLMWKGEVHKASTLHKELQAAKKY